MKNNLPKEVRSIFYHIYSGLRDLLLISVFMIIWHEIACNYGLMNEVEFGVLALASLFTWSVTKLYKYN